MSFIRSITWFSVISLSALQALATPAGQALIVGIETYPAESGFAAVRGSDRDARDLAAALEGAGFEVVVRRGSAALRRILIEDLRKLHAACSDASGTSVLFFSGRSYGRSRGDFLAPFDARASDLEISGIELDQWRQVCPGGRTLLILDVPAEMRPPGALTLKPGFRNANGLLEIRGGQPGRATHYDESLGGRVLARSLLSGLEGPAFDASGQLNLAVLAEQVDRSVRKWSFDHGLRQAPHIAGDPALLAAAPIGARGLEQSAGQAQLINLSLKDADLQEVLRSFARLAGVNMIIDPGVRGTVTLELHEVPWDQALEVILKSHGLGASLESSTLRVAPAAEIR